MCFAAVGIVHELQENLSKISRANVLRIQREERWDHPSILQRLLCMTYEPRGGAAFISDAK